MGGPSLRRAVAVTAYAVASLAPTVSAADRALLFLVDTSGSLRADDLERAKALVREFLSHTGEDGVVGAMAFDDRPRVVAPLGAEPGVAENGLAGMQIGGSHTVLHDALWDAAKLLGESGAPRRGIVLLSDGRDENSALLFADAERAVVENRVMVFAIGVGRVDEQFMRRFVKLTNGVYFPVESLSDPATIRVDVEAALQSIAIAPATPAPTAAPVVPATASEVPSPTPPGPLPTPVATEASPRWPPWLPLVLGALVLAVAGVALARALRRPPARGRAERSAPPVPAQAPRTAAARATAVARPDTAERSPARPAGGPLAKTLEPLDPLAATVNLRASDVLAAVERAANDPDATLTLGTRGLDDSGGLAGEAMDRTFLLAEQALLVVKKGRNLGERYLLDLHGDTFIGRAKVNDIVLDDRSVSTRHLRLRSEGMVVTALDLGSTNGSFLNERRMTEEKQLQAGDVLRIGETDLEFRVEQRAG